MKFTKVTNNLGQYSLNIERSDYDGFPPISEVTIDHPPTYSNPDREAVAFTLLFGPWNGGEFNFVQKVGPNTASEIRRFVEPIDVVCQPIEYYPKALPVGRIGSLLSTDIYDMGNNSFVDLPSDKFNGSLRTHDSMAVATNSFLFRRFEADLLPALGIAVLFAEDLDIDSFTVNNTVDPADFNRCRALLSSVRLGLRVDKD